MSLASADPVPWSNRQWWWIVALLFAVHLFLAFYLAKRTTIEAPSRARTVIRLLNPETLDPSSAQLLALRDPTIFALVHPRGFSGAAWLRIVPFPYQITNRTEPPRWLTPDVPQLANDFVQFVRTNVTLPLLEAEKPLPILSKVEIPNPITWIHPVLRIEGDLAGRRLISTNALPPPQPNVILTNCVIRVLVDARGRTLSHALLAGSGSQGADENAMNFAKAARFEPLARSLTDETPLASAGSAAFGTLVFQWVGTHEASTNIPSPKP
jgi:hypothetical protein